MDLATCIAQWRERRDPALADLVDVWTDAERPAPFLGTIDERNAAFFAALSDPEDFAAAGRAIAAFPFGTIEESLAQLEGLAALNDPRVCSRILHLLEDPPFRSPASLPFWQRALEVVEASEDGRATDRLARHEKRVFAILAPPMDRYLKRAVSQSRKRLAKRKPVTASSEGLAALAAARRASAAGDAAALLAAVRDAPELDGPRAVYADHLLEQGDPRGELIALQLTPTPLAKAQRAREKELLAGYATNWLGDLAPIIHKKHLAFERGFLARCALRAKSQAQVEAAIGHPAWSTVRSITLESKWRFQATIDRLVLDPVFSSLREIHGYTSPELLVALATSPPRPLTTLVHTQLVGQPSMSWSSMTGYAVMPPEGPRFPEEMMAALHDAPGLPALRDLTLEHLYRIDAKYLDWFFDGRLAPRLERFATRQHPDFIPSYQARFEALPLAVLDVVGAHEKSLFTFTRGTDGRLDQLAIDLAETDTLSYLPSLPGPLEAALLMLEAMNDEALAAVSLRWPKKKPPQPPLLQRLEALADARPWTVTW